MAEIGIYGEMWIMKDLYIKIGFSIIMDIPILYRKHLLISNSQVQKRQLYGRISIILYQQYLVYYLMEINGPLDGMV